MIEVLKPILIIITLGVVSLFLKNRKLTLLTTLIAIILSIFAFPNLDFKSHELIYDKSSHIFSIIILLTSIPIAVALYFEAEKYNDANTLFIFSVVSSILLTSTKNLILFIIMLETLTLSTIILVGIKKDYISLEGAIKYFLIGAISTGITVYGASVYYIGSREITISTPENLVQKIGLLLIFAGFAFKAGFFPLHFWIPDAYNSAPTSVAMLLSTIPKFAITASFL
ncbi:MAG: hypothetical protein NZ870_03085, partial [bacterium]|nr:hypothetical protein [bacterium]